MLKYNAIPYATFSLLLACAHPATFADTIYHVGYQNECMQAHPDVGSFFDADIWHGFLPPGEDDTAIFGSDFDPQGNGLRPHELFFGDFCRQVPDCPSVGFDADEARVENLSFVSEAWMLDSRSGKVGNCNPPGSGSGSLTVSDSLLVGVGADADAQLAWASGALAAAELVVGGDGGVGALDVLAGELTGDVLVGRGGVGSVNVSDGSQFIIDGDMAVGGASGNGSVTVREVGASIRVTGGIVAGSGTDASGRLVIERGGANVSCGYMILGQSRSGSGTASLRFNSILNAGDTLVVGGAGEGRVTADFDDVRISASTVVIGAENRSTGQVQMTGSSNTLGADLLVVGRGGQGDLTVESEFGGSVTAAELILAEEARGRGSMAQFGSSTRISGNVAVGHAGKGTYQIGGPLQSGSGVVGSEPGSTGRASARGRSATWVSSGPLSVGAGGRGVVTVESAASVSAETVEVGVRPGGDGRLEVTGTGSNVKGLTRVGSAGRGQATVRGGGHVSSATPGTGEPRDAYIGVAEGSSGLVELTNAASTWDGVNTLAVGVDGEANLTLRKGAAVVANMIEIGAPGVVTGSGRLSGGVDNAGRVEPGHSIGRLDVEGGYSQAGEGVLLVELGGNRPEKSFDVLAVGQSATLDGVLDVRMVQSFSPEHGDSFTVLTCAAREGQFAEVRTPDLGELRLATRYSSNQVDLVAVSDVNCDDVSRLKARCRNGRIRVRLATDLPPGTPLLIDNDGDLKSAIIDEQGAGRTVYRKQAGPHEITLVECPAKSRSVDCG